MTYVISDIHGNYKRFNSIMKQIDLHQEDTLYVLGDVIDRYPDGIRILRKLMKMKNVKMLLGNHEYMMLKALDPECEMAKQKREHYLRLWYRNGGDVTHNYLKHIRKEYRKEVFDYLRTLPINIDVEINCYKYKLVHSLPMDYYKKYPCKYDYDDEKEFSLWERWNKTFPFPEDYILVFGHTPTIRYQGNDPLEIWIKDSIIGIDCGCGYPESRFKGEPVGRLACLRLDDMKVFYSNEDDVNND